MVDRRQFLKLIAGATVVGATGGAVAKAVTRPKPPVLSRRAEKALKFAKLYGYQGDFIDSVEVGGGLTTRAWANVRGMGKTRATEIAMYNHLKANPKNTINYIHGNVTEEVTVGSQSFKELEERVLSYLYNKDEMQKAIESSMRHRPQFFIHWLTDAKS